MQKFLTVAAGVILLFWGFKLFLVVDRPLPGWKSGAKYHSQAVEQGKSDGRPMVVYFYTNWCPSCKNLNKNVLKVPSVQSALKPFSLVRINPEKGPDEMKLTQQYGIQGYPTVFLISFSGEKINRQPVARVDSSEHFIQQVTDFARRYGRAVPSATKSAEGPVKTLKLKNGRQLSGILTKQNEEGYWLDIAGTGEVFFSRKEVIEH